MCKIDPVTLAPDYYGSTYIFNGQHASSFVVDFVARETWELIDPEIEVNLINLIRSEINRWIYLE